MGIEVETVKFELIYIFYQFKLETNSARHNVLEKHKETLLKYEIRTI